jgi:glycosyltransferase involved in cell wall biosynthesis
MKLALVSSSFAPRVGSLERHVEALARGLARHGVEVEVVTQDASIRSARVSEADGVCIRQFPTSIGGLRFGMAPGLWEYLRRSAGSWDLVHLHSAHGALGLAVGSVPSRRLVFTPHVPIQRLLRRPYGHVARAVIERAAHTVPLSGVEGELIRSNFPRAADRVRVILPGADADAIQAASPAPCSGEVVLAVGRLERCERLERTIAAMASLDQRFRLVIVGQGPGARRLSRYAHDLRVAERVHFAGAVSGPGLYRWLRSARVLVTLSELEPSGLHVFEALSAGTSVVASDVPVHREAAASSTAAAGVRLVSAECSPLQLSDAIAAVADVRVPVGAGGTVPSAEAVAQKLLPLYRSLTDRAVAPTEMPANGNVHSALPGPNGGPEMAEAR